MVNWKTSVSLKTHIYNKLKDAILSGELADNMSITQRMAQDLYGTSGTPFREATQILESEGLVYSLPNKGMYVTPLTMKDVEEVFQVRTILETSIAEIVATDFTDEQYEELNVLINALNVDEEVQSRAEFTALDHEFHKKLIEYTGNTRLITINEQIYDVMRRIGNVILKKAKRREDVIKEHREILQGLKTGEVREPILHHLSQVRDEITKYYE